MFQDDEFEEVYDDGEIGEELNDIYEDDVEVGLLEDVYDDGEILEEEEYYELELDMLFFFFVLLKVWEKN